MKPTLSRRELGKLAAGSVAVFALGKFGAAQEKGTETAQVDEELKLVQAKLAEPLTGEALDIARKGIQNLRSAAESRWKTKLPENSEPCTLFVPQPAGKASP